MHRILIGLNEKVPSPVLFIRFISFAMLILPHVCHCFRRYAQVLFYDQQIETFAHATKAHVPHLSLCPDTELSRRLGVRPCS